VVSTGLVVGVEERAVVGTEIGRVPTPPGSIETDGPEPRFEQATTPSASTVARTGSVIKRFMVLGCPKGLGRHAREVQKLPGGVSDDAD
jgi:hypothetical protein